MFRVLNQMLKRTIGEENTTALVLVTARNLQQLQRGQFSLGELRQDFREARLIIDHQVDPTTFINPNQNGGRFFGGAAGNQIGPVGGVQPDDNTPVNCP